MRRVISILALFAILYTGQAIAAESVRITATSWLVADGSGKVIQGENTEQQRSIASITKLMTVMVVLDAKQDLDETIGLHTRLEIMQMALVKSDNRSANALCEFYPGGKDHCIRAMNVKAATLGMSNTKYVEPTGLSVFNVSNAMDLVRLVIAASDYPVIVAASKSSTIKIKMKRKWLIFKNTNPIIGQKHNFIVSKTGYINAAGGCIVMMLDTDVGRRIVVVLGSKNTHTRIPEAKFIAEKY